MYYIYHIHNRKIGCSKTPDARAQSQLKEGEKYNILFETEDINIASEMEQTFQKMLGYRVDRMPYSHSVEIGNSNLGRKHTIEHRDNIREAKKNFKHSTETKQKMTKAHAGKVLSESHKRNLSLAKKGVSIQPITEETKRKMSESAKGRVFSEEYRQKLSEGNKNTKKIECPHCGLTSHPGAMKRWHFDNCKHKGIK